MKTALRFMRLDLSGSEVMFGGWAVQESLLHFDSEGLPKRAGLILSFKDEPILPDAFHALQLSHDERYPEGGVLLPGPMHPRPQPSPLRPPPSHELSPRSESRISSPLSSELSTLFAVS